MGRHRKQIIYYYSLFLVVATGCSVAVPNATSLLSNLNSFKLTQNDISIDNLSDLSSITINARCDTSNLSFLYELPDIAAGTWNPVPSSAGSFFTSVTNNCSTNGQITMTLDLSATPPFMSMVLGSTYTINFKDVNLVPAVGQTETFRIHFSLYKIADDRFNNGQGLTDIKVGTTHALQGRIINIQQLEQAPGTTHMLDGKVVFQ